MLDRSRVIREAAVKAGSIIKNMSPTDGLVEKEGRSNFVTTADLASEKLIMEMIIDSFPTDQILSEETANDLPDILNIERLWVIDPIDGTNNYRFGRKYSAISIGYVEKGVSKIGSAYDPFHDDLYYAELGNEAYQNDQPLHVGNTHDLAKGTVATDNGSFPEGTHHNIDTALNLTPNPWTLMKGSTVLAMCDVAAGRLDLYFHRYFKPWDVAATQLIITEAGGIIKNIDGRDFDLTMDQLVCGNEALVNQFLKQME